MKLNLPIVDRLAACKNLLIAGMGGGYDVFCGLPIFLELRRRGQKAHLANFSFSDIARYQGGERLSDTLVGVRADDDRPVIYFPELHLVRWFEEKFNEKLHIWCFHKTGALPLLENYRLLVQRLSLDGILLIDGGVDCLVRGDEVATGTLIEDATSLFAVNELAEIPERIVACLGFGAEQSLSYAQVFENIANLTQAGGFLGSCALTTDMESYRGYEQAVLHVQGREYQDPSVINSSIISAVRGRYGDYHLTEKTRGSSLWISPLMPIYWFFDLPILAEQNLYLRQIGHTNTFMEAVLAYTMYSSTLPKRPAAGIPLQ